MLVNWTHIGPTMVATFLASMVEFVEALTVVLAVGVVRGWRGAVMGSGAAMLVLLAIIAILGPALTRIPLGVVQLAIGALLLLFGLRWLRKAILRAAGIIAMHDEAAIYDQQSQALRQERVASGGWDKLAFATAFKITMLEGIEVVFIVIALGAGGIGLLLPASFGALAALVVVVSLGIVVHRPLSHIPENTLKFVVGVLLSAFGTFWVGEGLGLAWPGEDWSTLGLIAGYLVGASIVMPVCRGRAIAAPSSNRRSRPMPWLKSIFREIFGLFVDDGEAAVAILAWLVFLWLVLPHLPISPVWHSAILFAGLIAILVESALRRARQR